MMFTVELDEDSLKAVEDMTQSAFLFAQDELQETWKSQETKKAIEKRAGVYADIIAAILKARVEALSK